MNIPNMPIGEMLERDAEGKFTGNMSPSWNMFLAALIQALQGGVSNEGFVIPGLSPTEYNLVHVVGNLAFDTLAKKLVINVDGSAYQTITSV